MIANIFLVILIILLILAALILFFPVCYTADIQKQEEKIAVRVRISWLFRFLHVLISFQKNEAESSLDKDVRLAGIRFLDLLKKRKEKKAGKAASRKPDRKIRTEASKKPTVRPGSKRQHTESSSGSTLPVEVVRAKHPGPAVRLSARISALIGKVKKTFRKIAGGAGVLRDWLEYLGTESFGKAKDVLLHEGTAILRHLLPRRIKGDVLFGTDDPAKTGMILGMIGVLYPVIPEKLHIDADFTESLLETDLTCKGHGILIVLIVRVIRIILCKDVRVLIKRILREMKAGSKKKDSKTGHKGRGKSWRKTKKTLHFRTT